MAIRWQSGGNHLHHPKVVIDQATTRVSVVDGEVARVRVAVEEAMPAQLLEVRIRQLGREVHLPKLGRHASLACTRRHTCSKDEVMRWDARCARDAYLVKPLSLECLVVRDLGARAVLHREHLRRGEILIHFGYLDGLGALKVGRKRAGRLPLNIEIHLTIQHIARGVRNRLPMGRRGAERAVVSTCMHGRPSVAINVPSS